MCLCVCARAVILTFTLYINATINWNQCTPKRKIANSQYTNSSLQSSILSAFGFCFDAFDWIWVRLHKSSSRKCFLLLLLLPLLFWYCLFVSRGIDYIHKTCSCNYFSISRQSYIIFPHELWYKYFKIDFESHINTRCLPPFYRLAASHRVRKSLSTTRAQIKREVCVYSVPDVRERVCVCIRATEVNWTVHDYDSLPRQMLQ